MPFHGENSQPLADPGCIGSWSQKCQISGTSVALKDIKRMWYLFWFRLVNGQPVLSPVPIGSFIRLNQINYSEFIWSTLSAWPVCWLIRPNAINWLYLLFTLSAGITTATLPQFCRSSDESDGNDDSSFNAPALIHSIVQCPVVSVINKIAEWIKAWSNLYRDTW